MTQNELDQMVAKATNEDLSEVRHLGFSLADPAQVNFDPEPYGPPNTVDWDELDGKRRFSA